MGGAKRVVLALDALGEARQAAALAERADAVATPGQDLVRVALVADVPDQAVAGCVEDMMQRNRQLDDAEAGAEVPAGLGHGVDEVVAQLVKIGAVDDARYAAGRAAALRRLGKGPGKIRALLAAKGVDQSLVDEALADTAITASGSDAALEAARQWRYTPARLNGMPIEVVTQIDIEFAR